MTGEPLIVAEPIEAWRVWNVSHLISAHLDLAAVTRLADDYDRGVNPFRNLLGWRLHAVGISSRPVWQERMEAACLRGDFSPNPYTTYYSGNYTTSSHVPHAAPFAGCSCGLWGLKREEDLIPAMARYASAGMTFAYGRVLLWGKVIEHANGYRAQHAKPVSLTLIDATEEQEADLAAYYRCPVTRADHPEAALVQRATLQAEQERHQMALMKQSMAMWSSAATGSVSLTTGDLSLGPPPRRRSRRLRWMNAAFAGLNGAWAAVGVVAGISPWAIGLSATVSGFCAFMAVRS